MEWRRRRPWAAGTRLARRCLLALLMLGGHLSAAPGEVVLRAGTLTELEPLSPLPSGFWYSSAWTGLVHQPLLTTGHDGQPSPCLARSWEVAADNRSVRFHLEPQARWHDGTPVRAADVAATIDAYGEHQLIGQIWRLYDRSDVIDDSTVVVRFREPVAFYQTLMFTVPPILPSHIWHDVAEPRRFAGADALIGSGRFAFVAFDVDARVAYLERSHNPALAPTIIDRVEVRFFADPGALWLALRRGDIDVVMGAERHVPPAFIDAVVGQAGVDTLSIPSAAVPLTLVFHGQQWPTSSRAFRRAVSLAVDSETFVRTVLRGRGQTAGSGFVPPGSWTWDGSRSPIRQDRAAATALLDSLGFVDRDGDGLREDPAGDPFVLPLIPETWQSTGEPLRATEVLIDQLRHIGLAASVERHVVDEEYALLWDQRDYLAYVGYTTPTSTRDGGHVYFAEYKDFSYGTFTDSAYHAVLDDITAAPDKAAYLAAVAAAQRWNRQQLPGLALAWGDRMLAWRGDRFQGWSPVAGEGLPSFASWASLRRVESPEHAPEEARNWFGLVAASAVVLGVAVWWRRRGA